MTTPIPSEELLPCPCCGKPPRLVDYAGWEIVCECGINLCLEKPDKEPLIAHWNLREHSSKEVAEAEPAYILNHSLDCEMAKPPRTYESLNEDGSTGVGVIIPMCTCDGKKTPLFLTPPSAHQAAASMKKRCIDWLKGMPQTEGGIAVHTVSFIVANIEAIPTVEESK